MKHSDSDLLDLVLCVGFGAVLLFTIASLIALTVMLAGLLLR